MDLYRSTKTLIKLTLKRLLLRRAIQAFRVDPEQAIQCDSYLFEILRLAWGNKSWSARTHYLKTCLNDALRTDGDILECGSGLTTILLGVVAERLGKHLISLEHDPGWAEKVSSTLTQLDIRSAEVALSPLVLGDGYSWYDAPADLLGRRFGLVVCDGPPGNVAGGRYGLFPVMKDCFKPGCIVLLDDYDREKEKRVVARWLSEAAGTLAIAENGPDSDCGHIRLINHPDKASTIAAGWLNPA